MFLRGSQACGKTMEHARSRPCPCLRLFVLPDYYNPANAGRQPCQRCGGGETKGIGQGAGLLCHLLRHAAPDA